MKITEAQKKKKALPSLKNLVIFLPLQRSTMYARNTNTLFLWALAEKQNIRHDLIEYAFHTFAVMKMTFSLNSTFYPNE